MIANLWKRLLCRILGHDRELLVYCECGNALVRCRRCEAKSRSFSVKEPK